jgi:two-component system chemotaxis sensor kinase CheA
VLESFRPEADMITSIHGLGDVVNVRGRMVPLLRLSDYFGITPAATDPTKCIGIVVQAGTNTRCLLADALVTKQEVVIKNLNELMAHKNRSFAGAAMDRWG